MLGARLLLLVLERGVVVELEPLLVELEVEDEGDDEVLVVMVEVVEVAVVEEERGVEGLGVSHISQLVLASLFSYVHVIQNHVVGADADGVA